LLFGSYVEDFVKCKGSILSNDELVVFVEALDADVWRFKQFSAY